MNIVYSNYISGPVRQVSDCLEIVLYNKSSFKELISLYNLENFYLKYLIGEDSDKHARLTREELVPFEYKKNLPNGFNVIVYISSFSGYPLGYTEFVNNQGVGVSLGIQINITQTLEGERIEVELDNKLVGKDLSKDYYGSELYNYTTIGEVKDRGYRNLFTSDIGRVRSDYFSFIIGSSVFTTKEKSWKLKVNKEIEVDSSMTGYNICFYKGNLVLAAWKNIQYVLYSLIGSAGSSLEGNTGTVEIKKIVGRYFYDTEGNLRDLETSNIVEKTKKTQFCDFLDPHCRVYDLPIFYSTSAIFKYIPEINNIYLDLNNYLMSSQVIISSKIGSWFVLCRDYGGTNVYTAVSPTTLIHMTEEDLEKSIFVGDQTLILCEEDYYSVYSTSEKELSTESARAIMYNGRLSWWTDDEGNPLFKFCFLDTAEDEIHFEEYYGDDGLVNIVYKVEDLNGTILRKYRRNIYPSSIGIPDLIGSYGGLIFYKNKVNSKTIINYL